MELKPTKVNNRPWLYAERLMNDYPSHTAQGGKWLIFVPINDIDHVWEKIKLATEQGLLGESSKVSTMLKSPYTNNLQTMVICVYTYDWTDKKDVMEIREMLRSLGITQEIPYKSDEDTRKGKYQKTGHIRISKYYE
ncbi:MAG: putative phosphothreonine lyase domain-containing protein [Promethearchaeota archaeon]